MGLEKNKIKLELLAPASNATVAIDAIKHGADAVYIGATGFGARKAASNSIEDIAKVVDFAHTFHARVYVTVNTVIYDSELRDVEKLCWRLYHIGVDALIVQDMALLRLNLPPIALHASTQCDIRTPEKAEFLEKVGMSQLVLARELTIPEIKAIVSVVTVPVECFIHGALCVSYSGKCHASCALTGRSANRGECSQLCRLPYTLTDGNGKVICRDKHLLSLKDFNASNQLPLLIEAGVRSFKIEGRLKDIAYVKNIVAYYSQLLDKFISEHPGIYRRSSFGKIALNFEPKPEKSFNRGFTDYFLSSRRPQSISSLATPKSMGEIISDVSELNNGDGISYFDNNGQYQGVNVNRVEQNRIIPSRKVRIPENAVIHRTNDIEWEKKMSKETSRRTLWVDIEIDVNGVVCNDELGNSLRLYLDVVKDKALKPMDFRSEFAKLGNTDYYLRNYVSKLPEDLFIPRSSLSDLRRRIIEMLKILNNITYKYDIRRNEYTEAKYPLRKLDFRENVANSLAEKFYFDHGVEKIEKALEITDDKAIKGRVVMTTRHCILRELGLCKRLGGRHISEPLKLSTTGRNFRLHFNCADCEMEVLTD